MFLREVVGIAEVEPGFELVANIVVSFDRGDFPAVYQVKIVVGLSAIAKTVGEVRRNEGKTENATNSNDKEVVGHGKFPMGGDQL